MFKWRNVYNGILMGISDLIPGVSGGTIALILGIYQSFIASINGIFTKEWKKHIPFLLPLGIGIVITLVSLSRVIEWMLIEYHQPTYFFFLGLILGIIPMLLKDINYSQSFAKFHYFLLVLAAIVVAATVFIKGDDVTGVMNELTWNEYILLFFGGWLASSAMILPGISGSFMLLLLGIYPTVINALSTINIQVLLIVGSGIVIGLVLTSRFITFLLNHFRVGTYAVMIGFIAGSMVVIFPGIDSDISLLLASVLAGLVGFCSAYLLSAIEKK
ncbi:DUF368 domain-containing protein [Anaerobacillus sp. MEB173]|uniref:DUF368 domain-containing protein n=1 Tax=Anaerobacillus sp. MEB173 TaxID=3383345 RepID=UPI003F92EA60